MARQGATETMTGAAPIAVSQLQPKAKPDPTIARPSMPRAYRLPIQDRSAPRSNSTRELAAHDHVRIDGDAVVLRDLQSVNDIRGRMRRGVLTLPAEPAPAAVAHLHIGETRDAGAHAIGDFSFVEDGIDIKAFPLLRAFNIVADLLRIEVRDLGLNLFQIEIHAHQYALRHHRGQEA